MIKLLVGLGNPGGQYARTRHNVGFWVLDALAEGLGCSWSEDKRFQACVAESRIAEDKLILLKPMTFMNKSGYAVVQALNYWKLQPVDLLVVHDELDFPVGVAKLKKDGGHAGHNGLRHIMAQLGHGDFYRLRVGIGRPAHKDMVVDYVLSSPSSEEKGLLKRVVEHLVSALPLLVLRDEPVLDLK